MKIVIHTSDSPFGNAALITKWHVKDRGWSNIGYHYVILNGQLSDKCYNSNFDGQIETGRPLDDDNLLEPEEFGAHVKGMNNQAVGVCLIGKNAKYTDKQINSLRVVLSLLKKQFTQIELYQHSDFEPAKPHCAGLSKEFMESLKLNL